MHDAYFSLSRRFIFERVHRNADTDVSRHDLGGSELSDPTHKKLAQCLQQIGDELDSNVELQK